jgi:creatinine amidohydrolase
VRLELMKWPQLGSMASRICVLPLGSLEQHGCHLPLVTDTVIVSEIAARIERAAPDDVVLAPTLWTGHSPHHEHFGSVSLDVRPYMDLVGSVCRSLVRMGARRILLLNGHGGNDVPVKAALREIKTEFREMPDLYVVYAAYWALAAEAFSRIRRSPPGGMGHACEMETSVMLSIHPEAVDMQAAVDGGPANEGKYRRLDMLHAQPYYVVNEFHELSASGTIGQPRFASAEQGEKFLDAAVGAALELIRELATWTYQARAETGT